MRDAWVTRDIRVVQRGETTVAAPGRIPASTRPIAVMPASAYLEASMREIPLLRSTNPPALTPMKDSTKNEIQGNAKQAAGKVKETTGKIVNNQNLQARGTNERVEGKIQEKVGEIQKVYEE